MKENLGDRHPVQAGETFLKTWTFRNVGDQDWPEDTYFIQTNGDDMQISSVLVQGPIKVGNEVEI